MNWLSRYAELIYSVMRIVVGLLFACHGGTKILGFPASQYGPATNTLGLVTGWIELICGFSVALGFFARVGAFFASGEMAVAYFMTSASRGFFPIGNGGEMAVVYCFIFFFFVFYGAGNWSIDFVLKAKASLSRPTY
jgi:putative oxidoreductase